VIATRVGALPEVFGEEIAFVEDVDGVPVLESVREALAAAGPELGGRLREKVIRLCSPDAVVARYAEILENLLETRS